MGSSLQSLLKKPPILWSSAASEKSRWYFYKTSRDSWYGTNRNVLLTWDFEMKCFVDMSSGWSWRRSWGHSQTRCQIGDCRGLRQGPQADTPHWWLIWGGQLRNVRESLWVRIYLVKQHTYFPGFRQAKAFYRSNLLFDKLTSSYFHATILLFSAGLFQHIRKVQAERDLTPHLTCETCGCYRAVLLKWEFFIKMRVGESQQSFDIEERWFNKNVLFFDENHFIFYYLKL